jgi:hypothetical protein
MKSRFIFLAVLFSTFLFACANTGTQVPGPTPQVVSVYTTASTQPWLADVFDCAPDNVIIQVSDGSVAADITLRLGEPGFAPPGMYQIDTEEILVVAHRQSSVQNMSLEQVGDLFAGTESSSMQVWVYASGEDVQGIFDQAVMQGRSVTSFARLAVSPGHMSDVLNTQSNAVGVLPRHWKAGDPREVYSLGTFPLLAVLRNPPQGAIQEIIACLQK